MLEFIQKVRDWMSKKTKILLAAFLAFLVIAIGFVIFCRKPDYLSPDKMKEKFEAAGYEVQMSDSCGAIKNITRVVAMKGDSIADFTYLKGSMDDEPIYDYYNEYYDNSYIMGNRNNGDQNLVYYTTDEEAWKVADIKSVNVSVDPIEVKGIE